MINILITILLIIFALLVVSLIVVAFKFATLEYKKD